MWAGKLIHTLSTIILIPLEVSYNPYPAERIDYPVINYLFLLMVRTFQYIIDFLNMMSLLYLFYCQGIASLARIEKNHSLDRILFSKSVRNNNKITFSNSESINIDKIQS